MEMLETFLRDFGASGHIEGSLIVANVYLSLVDYKFKKISPSTPMCSTDKILARALKADRDYPYLIASSPSGKISRYRCNLSGL